MSESGQGGFYSVMIKPASSLCNLECKYCFYADVSHRRDVMSYGIMTEQTARRIIQNIFADLPRGSSVSIGFQGGEPTLAGVDFFRYFADTVRAAAGSVHVEYTLQTNGTLLDDEWCRFLLEHKVLVGLSLDGDGELHDLNRADRHGVGSYSRVIAAKHLLERYGIEYNVLTVLTDRLARYPKRIWKLLCNQKIGYVQFIPCLDAPDSPMPSPYALTPGRFASFYTALFRLWAEALRSGRYISIKLFDDICNMLLKHQVTACGLDGICQRQIVVEADGSVYPCDFYAVDRWRLGNLAETPLTGLADNDTARAFRCRPKPVHAICADCRFAKLCGGGCARMADSMYVARDGKACGYRDFLARNEEEINRIAAEIYRGQYRF